jgi:hypothetical protein
MAQYFIKTTRAFRQRKQKSTYLALGVLTLRTKKVRTTDSRPLIFFPSRWGLKFCKLGWVKKKRYIDVGHDNIFPRYFSKKSPMYGLTKNFYLASHERLYNLAGHGVGRKSFVCLIEVSFFPGRFSFL